MVPLKKNPATIGRIDSFVEFHRTGAGITLKSMLRHLRKGTDEGHI